ncbi:MAG: hypothetical protein WDA47_09075 [Bacilli bacterium]|jgi:hypothetical protein
MSTVKDRLRQVLSERYLKDRYTITVAEYNAMSGQDKAKDWVPVYNGHSLIGYLEPLSDWEDRQAYWAWEQSMWETWLN